MRKTGPITMAALSLAMIFSGCRSYYGSRLYQKTAKLEKFDEHVESESFELKKEDDRINLYRTQLLTYQQKYREDEVERWCYEDPEVEDFI